MMKTITRRSTRIATVVAALVALGGVVAPGTAQAHQRNVVHTEVGIGFFYGTFLPDDNLLLLAGGSAEDFCNDSPVDTFFTAEPGSAPARIVERKDGSTRVRVRDRGQPIHVYEVGAAPGPVWIQGVCDAMFDDDPTTVAPDPIASGTAKLVIRDDIAGDTVDVYNAVRGRAASPDGTVYRIRASADFQVVDGELIGDPSEFVKFEMTEIGCRR